MATQSSIFAWEIPWTEEPGGLWGHKQSEMTEQLTLSLHFQFELWVKQQKVWEAQ